MHIVLIKSYTDKPWRNVETYRKIENSLRRKWDVSSIHTRSVEKLSDFLRGKRRVHGEDLLVFNIAEYLNEDEKSGFLPLLLEKWGYAHIGSSAKTIALSLNKAETKTRLIEAGIPTPGYAIATSDAPDIDIETEAIDFPLIVKPLEEGGHIGIDDNSIVTDEDSLQKAITRVLEEHKQPALIEEYITGDEMREFSVGIIEGEEAIFTPIEIDYDAMDVEEKILSFDVAQNDGEIIKFLEDGVMKNDIIDLTQRTFDAVGASGYSRVDLRMDDNRCYVLEINAMPGLGPHSFLPDAADELHDLSYSELIQRLAEEAIYKHGLGEKRSGHRSKSAV